jgi:putative DNA primase/helicase
MAIVTRWADEGKCPRRIVTMKTTANGYVDLQLERIPTELRELRQWIAFRCQRKPDGRLSKVPFTPGTNRTASINDPSTWRSFTEALAAVQAHNLCLGFAITREMNMTLVDEDGVVTADGTIEPATTARISALASYTERSISGTGIHILAMGKPPANAAKPAGVELYPGARFVLLTGDIIDDRDTIEERTAQLASLFPARPKPARPDIFDDITGDEAIERRGRTMAKWSTLFEHGDISDYPSHSEADGALCCLLARCGADAEQMDRIFRKSALYRPKWERADYRSKTIDTALEKVLPFEGWRRQERPAAEPVPHDAESSDDTAQADACASVRDELADLRRGIAELSRKNAELEQQVAAQAMMLTEQAATIDALRQVQSRGARILANRDLGPSRVVAATLATKFAWRATASARPSSEHGVAVPPGMMRLSVEEIAASSGVCVGSASKHLDALVERGCIWRKIETIREIADPTTGEMYDEPKHITAHFVGPTGAAALNPKCAVDFATNVANFKTERVEKRGGARIPRCPEHPKAEVIRHFTDTCQVCGEVLNTGEFKIPPMLLEPIPNERSTNFVDHNKSVDVVLKDTKLADRADAVADAATMTRFANPADRLLARSHVAAESAPAAGDDRRKGT